MRPFLNAGFGFPSLLFRARERDRFDIGVDIDASRRSVRPPATLSPDEPGPLRQDFANPAKSRERGRTAAGGRRRPAASARRK